MTDSTSGRTYCRMISRTQPLRPANDALPDPRQILMANFFVTHRLLQPQSDNNDTGVYGYAKLV